MKPVYGFIALLAFLACGCAASKAEIEERCFRDLTIGPEPVNGLEWEERWDRAIQKLGEIRSERAIPFLVRFIRDSHLPDSINYDSTAMLVFDSAEALGRIGRPALPEVEKLLVSEDVMHRRLALIALSEMGPEAREATPLVERVAAHDRSGRNRRFARDALDKLEGRPERPAPPPE